MFEFIRTHQRLMQFLLLLLIFPSFAFFGLEGYSRFRDDGNVVARVAGQVVTRQELDAEHRKQVGNMRQALGDRFDQSMFDTPEVKKNVLDGLVAQKALLAEAQRGKLAVPDQVLQQTILGIPGLRTPDGKFDGERYKSLLSIQGLTPAGFEAQLRRDMLLQQVSEAIEGTAFAPKSVAGRMSDLSEQEREIEELWFKHADYLPKVKITDDMLKAYYEKNAKAFEIPEQMTVEYVVLDMQTVAAQISVSDADVKSYYDQNQGRYAVGEERRASHILIDLAKGASAQDKAAAKAKAAQLAAQLKKNPAEFAKLAKLHSKDFGSAERGGDLDFFGRGMMTKPFADAAFNMKQGEISDPVESEFGYHVIQLTGIKPGSQRALEEAKAEIVAEIRKQQEIFRTCRILRQPRL
jgi:peptidyl-prolyl cis-trans isomerase D